MESSERCRRTDGKRWRCSKDVIPNEKYCQTHMHRGCRRRSRKLVESETTPTEPPNLNPTLPTPPKPIINAAAKDPRKNQASNAVKNADGKVPAVRLKIITHEISPQSVLVGKGPRAGEEDIPDEARRCRRTDGKRWRCTKEVIGEGHKYCANHMYRGAKKHCCHYNNTPNPYALVKRDHKLPFAFDTNPSL